MLKVQLFKEDCGNNDLISSGLIFGFFLSGTKSSSSLVAATSTLDCFGAFSFPDVRLGSKAIETLYC